MLWFPRAERSSLVDLERIYVKGTGGNLVPLSELGAWRQTIEDKTIFHRQLERVVYVTGEMAGRSPVETILDIRADEAHGQLQGFVDEHAKARPLESRTMFRKGGGIPWAVPSGISVHWWDEGEMYITLHLFRDLAFAMLAALIAIYIILMNQTGSYRLPLTIMRAIPLMVIGVMPGFWLLNQFGQRIDRRVHEPCLLLRPGIHGHDRAGRHRGPEFHHHCGLHSTRPAARAWRSRQAILESVSVRLRPILLTSGAAVLGALPITLDTVFGGMAWSLIFGLIASTLFSLFVIPVTYYVIYANKPDHGLPDKIRRKLAASLGQEPAMP